MTDGIIWVVDSVDRCRLEECRKQLRDILSQEKLAGASLLIFANKQDLGNKKSEIMLNRFSQCYTKLNFTLLECT
jgi:GTPase SAR1 family protein